MKQGYLVLASERRVLNMSFSDELDAIQQVLGCVAIEHGTTLHTEDQLLINWRQTQRRFDRSVLGGRRAVSVPGNAVLVGIDPCTGGIADQPVMGIDEFRRLLLFSGSSDTRRFGSAPHMH